MRIVIFGLGYVGLTLAGCLTAQGHTIVGIDPNEQKVRDVVAGRSPISEPGLEELLRDANAKSRLFAQQEIGSELSTADMAIVCVGTPSAPDGSHNLTHIAEVTRQIARALDAPRSSPLTVVYRSTIRPGTIEEIVLPIFGQHVADLSAQVEVVYNPEFLREATAIDDYFNPPKIVVGTADGQASARMDELHKDLKATTFYAQYRTAEFVKFVDNTWHATKVAFINEIARVAIRSGINPRMVHEIFVSDQKLNISAYYMRPGDAFGGSCLPKDVRALQYMANDMGVTSTLIDSILRSNEAHKHFIYDLCTRDLAPGAAILISGLAFKRNTDDLRESPSLDLVGRLVRGGYKVSIFDPSVDPKKLIGQNLGYAYAHLPNVSDFLVDFQVASSGAFDLIVDANGDGAQFRQGAPAYVSIYALDIEADAGRA